MFLTSLVSDLKGALTRGSDDLHAMVAERLPEVEKVASDIESDPLVHEALDAVENATLSPGQRAAVAGFVKFIKTELGKAAAQPAAPAVPDEPESVQAGVPEQPAPVQPAQEQPAAQPLI